MGAGSGRILGLLEVLFGEVALLAATYGTSERAGR